METSFFKIFSFSFVLPFWLSLMASPAVGIQRYAVDTGEKISRAVFSDAGETSPVITITGETMLIRHQHSGSGVVEGTSLRGSQSYQFTREGTYKIIPGTYKHIVYGKVPSQGSIAISSIIAERNGHERHLRFSNR